MTIYLLCFALFLVGLYGVLTKRDIVKIILSIGIMGYATNLFLVFVGYKSGAIYPILSEGKCIQPMVDPLPQALVLTSIVIELGTTALLVSLAIKLFQKYSTFDITKIRRLSG
ncbi:MAG: NADH-quinone oxidoreductase subunit K [Melioribacteraceae bacterium]|jgi:multicomponent Na+:H+ antiporter subunit C|nr:NADH-quinone oxidoreductase subunit K [Melioribacteraceae bacterium]